MTTISRRNFLKGMAAAAAAGAVPSANVLAQTGEEEFSNTFTGEIPSVDSYPIAPEEFGSGEIRYTMTEMNDGWVKVENEGGPVLGYSPKSGISLIQVDGYAFKNLSKSGSLELYEDWRQPAEVRAADIAARLTPHEIAGMMVFGGNLSSNLSADLNDEQKAALEDGLRCSGAASITDPVKDQVKWSNALQEYCEGTGYGIPMLFCSDPRNSGWGKGVSDYPDNLALAATFNPENATVAYQQIAKEFRALGITNLLGPQVDLNSEPRWGRNTASFGENPELSRDMAKAATSALQSTYDEEGNDLGWGPDSVLGMMKHFPGDGAAQDGREAHDKSGAFNIYPGNNFYMHLIPFIDGGLNLDSVTGEVASYMTSYSIAYSDYDEYGEQVASAYSAFKIGLLRDYGFDGVVCTDWQVIDGKNYGVENLEPAQRVEKALVAGVDQFGGEGDLDLIRSGIDLYINDYGEEATASIMHTGERLLREMVRVGVFENPYNELKNSVETVFSKNEDAIAMQSDTVVMLKNKDNVISPRDGEEKPTVYVPLVYTPATEGFVGQSYYSADLPVDRDYLEEYFNVVTDTVSETLTGPAGEDGEPTLAYADVIRASKEELAECDFALVFARTPKNTTWWNITGGYAMYTGEYIPISLQYGEYIADSQYVDKVSVAGNKIETTEESPYGTQTRTEQENQSYYGHAASIDNATDLDMINWVVENMPETGKVIVAINAEGKSPVAPMVVKEFESNVDALLYGFNVNNRAFLPIAAGTVEPSALLPIQIPADMETVEAQYEDVPMDMECHVDTEGNTYDFAFGLNWSGVIDDERVAKYGTFTLTAPETEKVV